MVGISDISLKRVRGDRWAFKIAYTDKDEVPIDLTDWTIDSVISWPDGSVTLTYDEVDLANGTFRLLCEPAANASVPEGRAAKLFVRVVDPDDEPNTIAIIPLLVIVP
jgi:hypothetical protein